MSSVTPIDKKALDITRQVLSDDDVYLIFSLMGSSGGYFLNSLLDEHPEIYTLPFEIRRAPIPFPEFYPEKKEDYIKELIESNERFFDARVGTSPGNTLDKLGPNRDQFILVDREKFIHFLNLILDQVEFGLWEFIVAIILAYNFARERFINTSHIAIYVHDMERALKLKNNTGKGRLLATCRHPASVFDSMCKRNFEKMAEHQRKHGYTNYLEPYLSTNVLGIRTFYDFFQSPIDRLGVVPIEELHAHPKTTMENVARYMGVNYHPALLKSTATGLLWWGSHKTRIQGFSETLHRELDAKEIGMNESLAILISTWQFQKLLGYSRRNQISVWDRLRARLGGVRYYQDRTKLLKQTLASPRSKQAKRSGFRKWFINLMNFSNLRLRSENRNLSKIEALDINADFSKIDIIAPLSNDSLNLHSAI